MKIWAVAITLVELLLGLAGVACAFIAVYYAIFTTDRLSWFLWQIAAVALGLAFHMIVEDEKKQHGE